MHELSLTQGVVDICQKYAQGKRVSVVTLEIGRLSSVVPEAMEFCFTACSDGTLLEGAQLIIKRVDGRGFCEDCCKEQPVSQLYDPCSECGGYALRITAGDKMQVLEIDVED